MPNTQQLSSNTPIAVVTGANSGIGRATTLAFAQAGYHVFGTVRGLSKADKLLTKARDLNVADRLTLVEMDVGNSTSVSTGFAQIFAATPHVDVLVNNAGVGGNAVTEECPIDTYTDVFNINHNGSVRCIQAVLPTMRERRRGAIVNVSSVVGRITAIAQSPYYVSKWAVEGMSEGLAHELAPFGIRVAIVELGITRSSIFGKNTDAPNDSGAYDSHYRRMFRFYEVGARHASPAEEVAEVIHHAVVTDQPRLRYACSWGGKAITAGRHSMSDEQWLELGAARADEEYYDRFAQHFGVDLHKS